MTFEDNLDIMRKNLDKRLDDDSQYYIGDARQCFSYNKSMISLAKLAGLIAGYYVPYIDNYKFFLNDPEYTHPLIESVDKNDIQKYILLCLTIPVRKYDFSGINYKTDFHNAMQKVKLDYKNGNYAFAVAQQTMLPYVCYSAFIPFKYIYDLYTVLVTEFLLKRTNLVLSEPLPEKTADLLNSYNIYTPFEKYTTIHCFFEKYLRTEEQRNKDYPFIYDYKLLGKTYSYREACELLYGTKCENDVRKIVETVLKDIYKGVNQTYTKSKLSHEDISMFVIWKMLFRSLDSKLDNNLVFNKVVSDNINPVLLFNAYSIENLYDKNTLCENRWSKDNSAIIYFSILSNAAAFDYNSIDLTSIWWNILDLLHEISSKGIDTVGYLTKKLIQAQKNIPKDITENSNIVSEYAYRYALYDFLTGLSTMVNVYSDITRAIPKFRNGCHHNAYGWTIGMNFRDITKEFVKETELWRLLCETEPENKRDINRLEDSIIKSLPKLCDTVDTICQNTSYTLRQHCATIWLYKNGGDIKITYPKGYHKRTNVPNTLSAIMKCNDDTRTANTNMWYNQIVITNFVEAYLKSITNPITYKQQLAVNLAGYTELFQYINNYVLKNMKPSYIMKALEYILTNAEMQIEKDIENNNFD